MRSRIFVGVVLLAVICLAGCVSKGRPQRAAPTRGAGQKAAVSRAPEKKPDKESALQARVQKARILWDDKDGRRVFEAGFKDATISQENSDAVAELRGVEASLYKNGKVASSLTAPRIVADSRRKEVRASGGVEITSTGDGASAHSERLIWKSDEDRILGAGAVRMTRGNITVKARAFEADTALKKARFTDAEMRMD